MQDTLSTEQEIKQEALTVIEQAKSIVIKDQGSYDQACSLLTQQIKPFRKKWKEFFDTMREPAYRAYQAILDKFNEGDKPLENAERQIKAAIAKWEFDQLQIQQELQRKAQEEAARREEEERLQAATLAEESGASEEEVQAIVEAPVVVVAPPVEPTFQKAAGISVRKNWKCRVVDMKKLCAAIGKGQVPVTYVLPNESALNARAKSDEATLNIPGCVAFNDPIVGGRSR